MARKQASGFIVVRKFDEVYHVLGMSAYGKFDFPRGTVDPGEDLFTAARREVTEEAGIKKLEMNWGQDSITVSNKKKDITLWLGETTDEPVIRPNPENGILEHDFYKWISFDEVENVGFHPFFYSALKWAKERVEGVTMESIMREWRCFTNE